MNRNLTVRSTLFLMLRARLAYFSVLSVSTKSQSDGDIHAIIVVLLQQTILLHYYYPC